MLVVRTKPMSAGTTSRLAYLIPVVLARPFGGFGNFLFGRAFHPARVQIQCVLCRRTLDPRRRDESTGQRFGAIGSSYTE